MSDWKLERRRTACEACERAFEEGERFFSTLAVTGDGLARRDWCDRCFEERRTTAAAGEGSGGGETDVDLVFWRTRRPPEGKRGLMLDLESIEGLFGALEGRSEERLLELRYLLALILMRKRRLKLVRTRRDGGRESFLVRRPRREEEIAVAVFDLDAERAAQLREELKRLFEGAELDELLAAPGAGRPGAETSDEAGGESDAEDPDAGESAAGDRRAPGGTRARS